MEDKTKKSSAGTKAKALCPNPPDAPVRSNGNMYCEANDPDFDREYAALIHVVNSVETVELEGAEFDPFDGSSVACSGTPSASDYYLCRSYCSGVGYQDTPEVFGAKMAKNAPIATNPPPLNDDFKNLKLPKPPTPILDKKSSRPRHVEIYFKDSKKWNDDLAKLEEKGVTVERVRLKRFELERMDGEKPKWMKLKKGESNKANKATIFDGRSAGDLFSPYRKIDSDTSRAKIYGYVAEVMFHFGTGDNGRHYDRGKSAEPLIVDMTEIKEN